MITLNFRYWDFQYDAIWCRPPHLTSFNWRGDYFQVSGGQSVMRVGGAHFKVGLTRDEIKDDKNPNPVSYLERILKDLFSTYDASIKHVDFRVDVEQVKKDIQKRTSKFLKKNK